MGGARRDMSTLNVVEANSRSPAGFNLISKPKAGVLELSRLTLGTSEVVDLELRLAQLLVCQ